jgi:hypothetical protein
MAATLITIEQARWQLRLTDTLQDPEVEMKMAQAEDVILRYLSPTVSGLPRDDYPWTPANVPPAVQDAILLYLTHLWRNRGDALDDTDEQTWKAITRRLAPLRDPALA